MAQIRIISSMATRQVFADVLPQFEQASGHRVSVESYGGAEATKRLNAGEAFDIVSLAANAIDQLIADGKVVAGSRVDLVDSGVAVAVRAGAPRIDIGSEEAIKQAILAARTIGYSTGPSGVYLTKLFERWGIAGQIKDRIVQAPTGVPVGAFIAKGEVELGFQQLSEMLHIPGIDILGPLPPAIQIITTFSAGIPVTSTQAEIAREVLAFLASPAADEAKRRNGLEPAA